MKQHTPLPLPLSRKGRGGKHQRGSAILTAMLLVTLVASLSAAALWQQWRAIETESVLRSQVQARWVVQGALDWSRRVLKDDDNNFDHLGEPWAIPLRDLPLAAFLAAQSGAADAGTDAGEVAMQDAKLSGAVTDLQARLNLNSLVLPGGAPHEPSVQAFTRLFDSLQLPRAELNLLVQQLRLAKTLQDPNQAAAEPVPLLPRTLAQAVWLGLSAGTVERLRPFVTVLPQATAVNLNTATAEVLAAAIATLPLSEARRVVVLRAKTPFQTLDAARRAMNLDPTALLETQHSVSSGYFAVQAQLRLEGLNIATQALVWRNAKTREVSVLWQDSIVP